MEYTLVQFKKEVKQNLTMICAYQFYDYTIGYNIYSKNPKIDIKRSYLPWEHCPSDMKFFKNQTDGEVVIMGYKTFESLNFKPLPNRLNIVLTSKDLKTNNPDVLFANSLFNVAEILKDLHESFEVYVIGGNNIYRQFYKACSRFLLNKISDNQPTNKNINKFIDENPNQQLIKRKIRLSKELIKHIETKAKISSINNEDENVTFYKYIISK